MFSKFREESAFSLAELMIAVFILGVVGLGLIGLLTNNTRSVGIARRRTKALNQASTIMEDIKSVARGYTGDSFEDYLEGEDGLDGFNLTDHSYSIDLDSNFTIEAGHPIEGLDNYDGRVYFTSDIESVGDLYRVRVELTLSDGSTVDLTSLLTGR